MWSDSETGTPQGAVVSPLLANVFLHYVFDIWAVRWRKQQAKGRMIVVRYADDIVAGFELETDARAFWDAMRTRFEQFALELHEDKTRLLEFERHAAKRRQRCGLGKPETFTFLGFTFICGKTRGGEYMLQRKTRTDRMKTNRMTWARMTKIAAAWLPTPRILHPWPAERFAVKHPRWEPSA